MKTERLALLVTPEFKARLQAEASTRGISVGELVRLRCEPAEDADAAELRALTVELRRSTEVAHEALAATLAEWQALQKARPTPQPATTLRAAA